MKVTGKRVMIIPDEPEKGFILTTETKAVNTGVVKGVGSKVTNIQVNDWVLFNEKRADILNIDGQDLIIVNEDDIHATIED